MPNWVYNRLTVKGEAKDLKSFSESIGSKGLPIDFPKLATIVTRSWDSRDERDDSRVEKVKGGLIYFFDTAWGSRTDLVRDLSNAFPQLSLELYFIEETEQFAGAMICKAGKISGEAYLGDEELDDFMVSSEDWSDEEEEDDLQDVELDKDSLEGELLKRAHAGGVVNWDARKAKLELLRSDVETATLTRLRSRIQDLTCNPKLHPPKKKHTDETLCKAIRAFESNYSYRKHADINLVPLEYLSDWVALQFCMTHDENWKKLPKSLQTQTFWDKYIKCKETLSSFYNPPLKRIPQKYRSDSLVRYALKHDIYALEALKTADRTPERCKLAVQRYGQQLKHVPQKLRTEELCQIAVTNNGMSLQYVPKHQRTSKLCELATYKGKGYNALAIQFVPSKLITAKMLEHFITSPRGRSYGNSLSPSSIPVRLRTYEMLKALLPTQPKLLPILKPEMLEKLWQIEGYPERVVECSGWHFNWFEHIPETYISKGLYQYVVQNHGPTYFKNLPDRYKTKILSLEAFNTRGCEVLPYVPDAVFTQEFCKELLQSQFFEQHWLLNSRIIDLSEFVYSIPAMHIPAHAWSDVLIKLATKQTKYSVLAFPKKWVNDSDFKKILDDDPRFYYCFGDDVKETFKDYLSTLLKDTESEFFSKIHYLSSIINTVGLTFQIEDLTQLLEDNQKNLGNLDHDIAEKINSIKSNFTGIGSIKTHENSQKIILHWAKNINKCISISNKMKSLEKTLQSLLDSIGNNEANYRNELKGVDAQTLKGLANLFGITAMFDKIFASLKPD